MRKMLAVILLLAFASFADVGPPPPKPNLVITFFSGNSTYSGNINATFVCSEISPLNHDASREINLSCTGSTCTNDQWYYKFDPCYYPNSSYVKYSLDGGITYKNSGELSFPKGETYQVSIDAGNGNITNNTNFLCLPTGLILLVAGAFAMRR